ncbi:MAG: YdeI/OmpD-associated family protein [Alphaproteobacteria bacterium]|nr:YdeI/OmpD-associated family protein [Alphaproteobacteria bacterium]MBU2377694.1 YdeI/OmpD-associated family protein [Alphaproteobacteria bacterium]
MAPMTVDPQRVRMFEHAGAFHDWLAANGESEPEVWIRVFKVASGTPSVTWKDAIPAALAWGWIDGVRKSLDDVSFLQRFTPRGPKSSWSEINVAHAERMIADGTMQPAGLKQVEAARADGRWEKTYRVKGAAVPDDLMAAIDAEPQARAMFDALTSQNRFALIHRTNALKTEAGRTKKIAGFVAMLARGETIYPQAKIR